MKGDKVSVIIPVYNAEKYLRECLDSVLNQTYKNVEIIAVNDGSTDNSLLILNEYTSNYPNIKVIDKENGGVCSARNIGLENAKGEYITFVDSDDFLPSDSLQTLYQDITENNADMAIGRVVSDKDNANLENKCEIWSGCQGLVEELEDNPFVYGCYSKLYKKTLIEDIRFVLGRKVHEDGYFVFLTLLKEPKIVVSNRCTYIYRTNLESASRAKFSDKFFDILYFEKLKREKVCELYPDLRDKAYNKLVKAHLTLLHCLCTTRDKKYNINVKNSKKMVRKYSKYFIPSIKGDKKFYLIVKFGLYGFFRRLYWIKYKIK